MLIGGLTLKACFRSGVTQLIFFDQPREFHGDVKPLREKLERQRKRSREGLPVWALGEWESDRGSCTQWGGF